MSPTRATGTTSTTGTAPLYRYEVPFQRVGTSPADSGLRTTQVVHAPTAEAAMRAALAVLPAASVDAPARLGEVLPVQTSAPDGTHVDVAAATHTRRIVPPIACPSCALRACTVLCHACGAFKLPKHVAPFAEREAA